MSDRSAIIQEAHQLFLFGAPGSIAPVRTVQELSVRTGLSAATIAQLLPAWKADLQARSAALSAVYGNAAAPDVMSDHEDDLALIREQLTLAREAVRKELKVAEGDLQAARYLTAMDHFIGLKRQWDKLTGVTATINMAGEARRLVIEELIKATPKPRAATGRDVTDDPAFADGDAIDIPASGDTDGA